MKKYMELDAEIVYIVFRAIALLPAMNWMLSSLIIKKKVLGVLRVVKLVFPTSIISLM